MQTRVLWLIRGLGPGGAERLLVNQARVRDRSRYAVCVAYEVAAKSHLVPDLEALGVPARLLPPRWFASPCALRRLMAGADIVHVHSPSLAARARLLRLTLPARRRPRLVTTEHNSWGAFRRPTRLANGLTAWLDDARVAVSRAAADSMWRPLRGSTEVIDHGVPLVELARVGTDRDAARERLGVRPDTLLAVTVANFRREKDYPNLLAAAQRAAAALGGRFHLIAVGQGPLEAEIRAEHRRLGLDGVVDLVGYREDAWDVIAAGDVFVLGSRHEGKPVALMEAMAMGRAVVVTSAGGMAEMVTDGIEGLVVPAQDPVALSAALSRVLTDPHLRQRCAAAAAVRAADYDVVAAQRRLEEIYADVIAGRHPTATAGRRRR